MRYAAATRLALAAPRRADAVVAAGHTADDQVETILYRLASSPSRRALLGMRPRDGLLVRPLLGVTRAQTTAYCEQRGLAWRDDVTNGGDRYARNRVRNGLVPALEQIHPAAAANVLRTAALLRDEGEVLDALVGEQLDERGGRLEIPLERLAALPPALRRLVVQRLADGAAGKLVPGAAKHADEVAGAAPHRPRDARPRRRRARGRRARRAARRARRSRLRLRTLPPSWATRRSARSWSSRTTCSTASASWGRRSRATTPAESRCSCAC